MIKPLEGYILAEIKTKETNSGIVLPEKENSINKIMVVKAIHKTASDIKVGDEIIIRPDCQILEVKGEDEKKYMIVPVDGICAIR